MANPIMQMMMGAGGSGVLNGLMQTAKTTLKGQTPQMVLNFLASQPGFNEWFAANKDKTIAELLNQANR